MKFVTPTVLMFFCFQVAACASDPKPPPEVPDEGFGSGSQNVAQAEGKPGDDPNQSQISISDEIKRLCGISDSDAHFAFNSSNIQARDKKVLKQLADCFTTGPLKGREMRLVGHADPRGEAEYNLVLGGRRADNVKRYITAAGLKAAQASTTSRGEMDATGTDETSWAKDRRVDIMLGD